jgi:hypothetical protein
MWWKFPVHVQTGPGSFLTSCTVGAGYFSPGVKMARRGVYRLFSSAVKERVDLYVCLTSAPSWPVLVWPLSLPLLRVRCKLQVICDAKLADISTTAKSAEYLQNKHRNTSQVDLCAFSLHVAVPLIIRSSNIGLSEF